MTAVVPPEPTTRALSPFETGPGTPAGRYLRSFWQPVATSEDLIAGTARSIRVMSEDYTLYRGEDGTAVLSGALCPHRLTSLAIGTVEGQAIRCRFHGWKFGPDGRCREAPLQTPRLVERISIPTFPVREKYGLVFAYLGEGPEPPLPDVDAFSRDHGSDIFSAPIVYNWVYRRLCNYYINTENSVDLAHVPYTHAVSSNPTLTKVGFSADLGVVRDITVQRLDYGVRVSDTDASGFHSDVAVLLPNVMHLQVGQRIGRIEMFAWRVPIDDDSHRSFQISAVHTDEQGAREYRAMQEELRRLAAEYPAPELCAEEIARGEKTLLDFVDHPHLSYIEDALTQQGMRHIADVEKQNLAQSDKGVLQLRRMFSSRVVAFLEGDLSAVGGW